MREKTAVEVYNESLKEGEIRISEADFAVIKKDTQYCHRRCQVY